jgi:small conductance mechanosensitive channel
MMHLDANKLMDMAGTLVGEWAPRLLTAIIVLVVGLWIIARLISLLGRLLDARNIDPTLRPFLLSVGGVGMKLMLLISVAGMVGIATTSFVAVLGAAGLAVGLALQGSLSNFAGGVLILILRPYKVGDYIETQGHAGSVKAVQIFNTVLLTPDNRRIIVPNGPIANGSIVNYSAMPTRRCDMSFGIGYRDDIGLARDIILELASADTRVHKDPAPFVEVGELADSSVNLVVRLWLDSGDYWAVRFDMMRKVKESFDARGITIPFPQRDVHHYNHTA